MAKMKDKVFMKFDSFRFEQTKPCHFDVIFMYQGNDLYTIKQKAILDSGDIICIQGIQGTMEGKEE